MTNCHPPQSGGHLELVRLLMSFIISGQYSRSFPLPCVEHLRGTLSSEWGEGELDDDLILISKIIPQSPPAVQSCLRSIKPIASSSLDDCCSS